MIAESKTSALNSAETSDVRLCRTGMTPCPTGRCYQDDTWAYGLVRWLRSMKKRQSHCCPQSRAGVALYCGSHCHGLMRMFEPDRAECHGGKGDGGKSMNAMNHFFEPRKEQEL